MDGCEHKVSESVDFGIKVCVECGQVLEETVIRNEIEHDRGGFNERCGTSLKSNNLFQGDPEFSKNYLSNPFAPKNTLGRYNPRKLEISSKVNQFTARLGLKNSKDQVIFLFKTAMEKGKWRYGEVSHLVLSCCLYIQARIDKKPVSLSHIANLVELDKYRIGKYYRKVKEILQIKIPDIDPIVFLEKICHELELGEDKHKILTGATKIISLAKLDSIEEGKSPEPIARAAICLMLGVYKNLNFSQAIKLQHYSQELVTIRSRYAELKNMLFHLGTQLPWGNMITEENFFQFVPDIFEFESLFQEKDRIEEKSETSEPILFQSEDKKAVQTPNSKKRKKNPILASPEALFPSSYVSNLKNSKLWEEKIEKAQSNLQLLDDDQKVKENENENENENDKNGKDEKFNEEIFAIQKAILFGVPIDVLKSNPLTISKIETLCKTHNKKLKVNDSPELTNEDIPDDELDLYIKKPHEVMENIKAKKFVN